MRAQSWMLPVGMALSLLCIDGLQHRDVKCGVRQISYIDGGKSYKDMTKLGFEFVSSDASTKKFGYKSGFAGYTPGDAEKDAAEFQKLRQRYAACQE